jgi:hypothetical protein
MSFEGSESAFSFRPRSAQTKLQQQFNQSHAELGTSAFFMYSCAGMRRVSACVDAWCLIRVWFASDWLRVWFVLRAGKPWAAAGGGGPWH